MNNRAELVKTFFNKPERYLKTNFNIRIRAEVVKGFVGEDKFEAILDIGCGNGAISLPLLNQNNHLTLLDISDAMLSVVKSYITTGLFQNVKIINDDFIRAELPLQSYDLILCLGVLAHIDSPLKSIEKMISLLRPNGCIIVQNTDAHHPIGYLYNLYSIFQSFFLGRSYTLNHISSSKIIETFKDTGMELVHIYRYSPPIPGMGRVICNYNLYRFIRKIYGSYKDNRYQWLGSEHIICFKRMS